MKNTRIKPILRKTFYIVILIVAFLLSNCTENNKEIIQNKDETKLEILDTNFGCYKLEKVGETLKSGVVFYPSKMPTNRNNPNMENCPAMNKAKSMDFSNRPAVILVHGFNSDETSLHYQARYLAKMGFVAMSFTTKWNNNFSLIEVYPKLWADAYKDMIKSLDYENSLQNSPVFSKINTKNISLIGHSMGGGGLFYFVDKYTDIKINSIIALAPYFSIAENNKIGVKMKSPVLILSGANDIVAPPSHQDKYYSNVANSTIKTLVKLNKVSHSDHGSYGSDEKHEIIDKYIKDWLKIYVYKIPIESTTFSKSSLEKLKTNHEIAKYLTTNFE